MRMGYSTGLVDAVGCGEVLALGSVFARRVQNGGYIDVLVVASSKNWLAGCLVG